MKTIRTLSALRFCIWVCLAVPAFGKAPDAEGRAAAGEAVFTLTTKAPIKVPSAFTAHFLPAAR